MVESQTSGDKQMAGTGVSPPATRRVALSTPIGWVMATLAAEQVVMVDILPEPAPAGADGGSDPLILRVSEALQEYFQHGHWPADLPLAPAGTAFQRRVWDCMLAIPPGRTRSYSDIARELGSSARAVGNACRANPIPLLIPCHRVVAKRGLGGFGGQTRGRLPKIKAWLLRHEQLQP
jgi:methylated-DNA-[protein]-cysteine S-methyltransferase